jgi:hypothetical protein
VVTPNREISSRKSEEMNLCDMMQQPEGVPVVEFDLIRKKLVQKKNCVRANSFVSSRIPI